MKTEIYKVKESDLIGQLEGCQIEVVQRMIECQVEQRNKADVSVFQELSTSSVHEGGFRWEDTVEGHGFWNRVIKHKRLDMWFEKYPKSPHTLEAKDHTTTSNTDASDPEYKNLRIFLCGNTNQIEAGNIFGKAKNDASIWRFDPVSPLDLPKGSPLWHHIAMRRLDLLMSCEAIYMMDGWDRSQQCRIERVFSEKMGLLVIEEAAQGPK